MNISLARPSSPAGSAQGHFSAQRHETVCQLTRSGERTPTHSHFRHDSRTHTHNTQAHMPSYPWLLEIWRSLKKTCHHTYPSMYHPLHVMTLSLSFLSLVLSIRQSIQSVPICEEEIGYCYPPVVSIRGICRRANGSLQ